MKFEDLLHDDFLKQFKTGDKLSNFLVKIQKRGIEKILEGELDAYLNYDKHQSNTNDNARNGYSKKKVRTTLREFEISVPRDRDGSFNSMIVKKRQNQLRYRCLEKQTFRTLLFDCLDGWNRI